MGQSIKINHEKKYIHYSHNGIIDRNDIGEVWRQLLAMPEFTQEKYNLLSDYRGATFNFTPAEIGVIDSFLQSIKAVLDGKKNAVIVDNPAGTVISMLFENRVNFQVKTFCTVQAALKFLH